MTRSMGIFRSLGASLLFLSVLLVCVYSANAQDGGEAEVISEPPPVSQSPQTLPSRPSSTVSSQGTATTTGPQPRETANLDLEPKQPLGIWRFGGGFGFSYFNDYLFLSIEPQASYLIKRIVEPGAALVYQWSKDKFPDPNVIRHTIGGRLFARVYPIRQLFILVEGELLNSGIKQGDSTADRENYPNLFLGGGFVFGLGKGAFFSTGLKVNIFTSDLYPDHFPIFSIGAGVGF